MKTPPVAEARVEVSARGEAGDDQLRLGIGLREGAAGDDDPPVRLDRDVVDLPGGVGFLSEVLDREAGVAEAADQVAFVVEFGQPRPDLGFTPCDHRAIGERP